jgi:hypothetical protein
MPPRKRRYIELDLELLGTRTAGSVLDELESDPSVYSFQYVVGSKVLHVSVYLPQVFNDLAGVDIDGSSLAEE